VMGRLTAWALDLAAVALTHLVGPAQREWGSRLETEDDNLRAVLTWALDGRQAAVAQRLVGLLGTFWHNRGHLREGRSWGERALALGDGGATDERISALWRTADIAIQQGDFARATELAHECLSLSQTTSHAIGHDRGVARGMWVLGHVAAVQE